MSGSKSSLPDAGAPPEALGLTVYRLEAPDLGRERRRTRLGRLQMLLVLAICAAPVVASYFMYFVARPDALTNYGTLISPTRGLPERTFVGENGSTQPSTRLRGQWLLVVVGPAACDPACEKRLYTQRQLREMLGRDRERVDKVWFVTDQAPLAPALRQAVEAVPTVTVLRFPAAELARWLEPAAGHGLEEHLYLVDPMGEWMMRFPTDPDPSRVKRDLERLLRASASWDRPGR